MKKLTIAISLMVATSVFAAPVTSKLQPMDTQVSPSMNWYVGGNLAYSLMAGSLTQDLHVSTTLTEDRIKFNAGNGGFLYGVNFGAHFNTGKIWFPGYQLEAQYQGNTGGQITGNHTYAVTGASTDAKATLDVHSQLLGVNGLVDVYQWYVAGGNGRIAPYLQAGVGIDMVSTTNYDEDDNGSELTFSKGNSNNIYYQGGVGVHYYVNQWQFGLGYLYQNLGNLKTDAGYTGETAVPELTNIKVVTNNILFTVNYAF